VTLHEPMTLATDYLLGAAALWFAVRLWSVHRLWALAFACTAAASFCGGTYHGLLPDPVLWKFTVFSVGLASFFLLAGTARRLAALAAVKLVVYLSWMIAHDDFVWVIADYGITLLLVGVVRWRNRWVIGSIALSIVGALVQQSGFALHRHFNHNDIYHVIQLAALWLLYRGGLQERAPLTTSATGRPTSPPR
jgi:hypothetical protein